MAKFKAGDKFKAKDTGHTGTVQGVSYDYSSNTDDYRIEWDHVPGVHYYQAHDVDTDWEKIISLPTGASPYTWDYKVGCDHEWVDVGFHFTKMVCKKCDKDKA